METRKSTIALLLLVLLLLFFVRCDLAKADIVYDFLTDEKIGFRWDSSTGAVGYEWHIKRVSDNVVVVSGSTSILQAYAYVSSAGLYVAYIRAYNLKGAGGARRYSGWATSLTHSKTEPWRVLVKLKPVGTLTFE